MMKNPQVVIRSESGLGKDTTVETSDGVTIPMVTAVELSCSEPGGAWNCVLRTWLPQLYLKASLTGKCKDKMIMDCKNMLEWLNADAEPERST